MKSLSSILLVALTAAAVLAGCRHKEVDADAPPRVVSFAPSITQMIFDMGLGEHVVGVTTQCILPPGQSRRVVGDALSINAEAIVATQPDLLLVQIQPEAFETVRKMDPRIRIEYFRIEILADIAAAMERIGSLLEDPAAGTAAAEEFRAALDRVRQRTAGGVRLRVMFLLGTERASTAGAGTFLDGMIAAAGGANAAGSLTGWVNVNLEQVIVAAPEVVLCQAAPGQAEVTRAFWQSVDIPAAKTGRIYVITDLRLTIPSGRSAAFVQQFAEWFGPEEAATP